VTEKPGRVVTEEIDIDVTVHIGQRGPFPRGEDQRKGGMSQNRSGVASREDFAGRLEVPATVGVAISESLTNADQSGGVCCHRMVF
jgi:hypothetical protein